MSNEALVIGGVLVLGGLVVLWHLTFSVDPRIHPHPFVLRPFEPRWERWDDLDWESKMRIFRRRQVVNWTFVVLVVALLIFLFLVAVRGAQSGAQVPAVSRAGVVVSRPGDPLGPAATPDGR